MAEVAIRPVRIEDARDICEINCSDVEEWMSGPAGDLRFTPEYESLSIADRFAFGGPWMSIETCAIHINNMLTSRNTVLVAEMDGKVIGHAEVFIGDDPPPFGRNAHLSVLWLHRDSRRRGIGGQLVEACLSAARNALCDTFSVVPDEDAEAFYRKSGMEPFFEQQILHIPVGTCDGDHKAEDLPPQPYPAIQGLTMRAGRFQSSRQSWDHLTWPAYVLAGEFEEFPLRRISTGGTTLIVAAEPMFGHPSIGRVSIWAPLEMDMSAVVRIALSECDASGFSRAQFLVAASEAPKLLDEFGGEILGNRMIWARKLNSCA